MDAIDRNCPASEWRGRDLAGVGMLALIFLAGFAILTRPFLARDALCGVAAGVWLEAAAVLIAMFLAARWRGLRLRFRLGPPRGSWQRKLLIGEGAGMALFLVHWGWIALWGALGAAPPPSALPDGIAGTSPGGFIFFTITIGLIAPIWEELFFRGLTHTIIRRRLGAAAAVIISASLFALLHDESWLVRPVIFLSGVGFSLLYELTGSLHAPICAHAFINLMSSFLAYFPGRFHI